MREFIKTIEKIGVVLPKVQDIQLVFDYYDLDKKGRIDYKKLAQEIFDPNTKQKRVFVDNNQEKESLLDKNLINKLTGKKYFSIKYLRIILKIFLHFLSFLEIIHS